MSLIEYNRLIKLGIEDYETEQSIIKLYTWLSEESKNHLIKEWGELKEQIRKIGSE